MILKILLNKRGNFLNGRKWKRQIWRVKVQRENALFLLEDELGKSMIDFYLQTKPILTLKPPKLQLNICTVIFNPKLSHYLDLTPVLFSTPDQPHLHFTLAVMFDPNIIISINTMILDTTISVCLLNNLRTQKSTQKSDTNFSYALKCDKRKNPAKSNALLFEHQNMQVDVCKIEQTVTHHHVIQIFFLRTTAEADLCQSHDKR